MNNNSYTPRTLTIEKIARKISDAGIGGLPISKIKNRKALEWMYKRGYIVRIHVEGKNHKIAGSRLALTKKGYEKFIK